ELLPDREGEDGPVPKEPLGAVRPARKSALVTGPGRALTIGFRKRLSLRRISQGDSTKEGAMKKPFRLPLIDFAAVAGVAVAGKAYAVVFSGQLQANLTLTGDVVVGDPTSPALMAAYGQCKSATDPATPAAVWVLNTQLQGQTLQVPAFVNQVGPYLVQEICLLPPASAPFKAQLWLADFTVNGVFTNASASNAYSWAADFTPYAASVPNPSGTVAYR